jgi:hypothetical protein
MGHVRVTGTAGHDQIMQRMLAEPPRDGGHRRFAAGVRGARCLSAPETMARTAATAACRLGASAVTTLMMVPAVCALAMLADLHRAAWLAAAA